MGKVMRHTLGASLNIRHNLSSSKGPKPLQLKLLTTYIPKTSAFTLAFSTSQRLRTTRASVCRMTFPILASLLVRLVVLLPFQLLRLSLATPSRWTPLALSVFLHCVVALLLTLL